MVAKILQEARPIFFISLSIFFLVSSGFVIRLYWLADPTRYVGKKLLDNNGSLLVSILSNPRLVSALRSSGNDPNRKKKKSVGEYVIDRLFEKEGKLFSTLSHGLLEKETFRKALLESLFPWAKVPVSSTKQEGTGYRLGKHAIDALLAKDARLAAALSGKLLPHLFPKEKEPKGAKKGTGWEVALLEKLGRHVVSVLTKDDARISRKLLETLLQDRTPAKMSTKKGVSSSSEYAAVIERLGTRLGTQALQELLKKDAKLLIHFVKEISKGSPQKTVPTKKPTAPAYVLAGERLGMHLIKQLLKKDGFLARKIASKLLLASLSAQNESTKKSVSEIYAKSLERLGQRLGRYLIDKLLKKDARLISKISTSLIKQSRQNNKVPKTFVPAKQRLEYLIATKLGGDLGRHLINRMLDKRARPLRALTRELIGAEGMRLVREARFTLKEANHKLKKLQVAHVAREAAYELGRGALDTFLRKQQHDKRLLGRKQREIQRVAFALKKTLSKRVPCMKTHGKQWLKWNKEVLQLQMSLDSNSRKCLISKCNDYHKQVHAAASTALKKRKIHPNDLQVKVHPACP